MGGGTQAPSYNGNGEQIPDNFTLDDLRACIVESNSHDPKRAFNILRAATWADGSPKEKWFRVESVPPEHWDRLVKEIVDY
jgi:hypothetical protein